ncbi:hypothetical protein PAHAL_4G248200 [Panicum hallii]|uniref:non-specific serine/threonine protein kinase n=1 Tax=Panicum hallii TaxID=206008 RepID=A0A2S3HJY7_9POAL|nr:proline-rich receptor-like protein kinase PERK12 [Panicum hallii]PAN24735.1 hypothetical protein PAHAL_4G248200 [Panicum hallii]
MSDIAPSPSSSSSSEENRSGSGSSNNNDDNNNDNDSRAPPPNDSSSDSGSSSSPNSKGWSSPPPSPSSESSRSTPPSDSEDSPSSSPPSPSGSSPSNSSPPPSSEQSPSPPPSPFWSGGNSKSSPPPTPPSESSRNSGDNSNSSPPPGRSSSSSPPRRSEGSSLPQPPSSSSNQQVPPNPSGRSSSSSSRESPPSLPQESNDDQSTNSQPSRSPPSSSSSASPPPPTNQSVVIIPVPVSSNSSPVSIAPGAAVGTLTSANNLPPSSQGTNGSTAGSSSRSSLGSSGVGTSHVAAAIAGAAITGLMFAMLAVFFITRRRRKTTDGLVYHNDGNNNLPSGQFGVSNPSGALYPGGASAGFSPPSGPDSGGGGYYQSGRMEPPGSKSSFSYEELTSITSNFSRDNVIGEGGFGCVYKGWLADGKCVAVKQLKAGSGQGEREFQAEVEIISRVHHRHLVSLVGYCIAQHHRMLIYEFVPNGTLEHHLHSRGMPVMDWPTRLKIAIGAAKGLAYLHEDCQPRIIHRDIKSANILLDYSFEAQVADFGLAKLSNDTHTHVSTRIMGTFGYLAPEYASSGKLTDRSDVFSFGVVLLELVTGRKPVDQTRPGEESLVEWARPVLVDAVETGDLDAVVDPRLEGAYNRGEMIVMVEAAAACVRHSAPKRPRMVQVMRALDNEGSMSDLSNGVKVGQSRNYHGSGQEAAAIQQLRLTAFPSEQYTGEFEQSSGEYRGAYSETQPINRR